MEITPTELASGVFQFVQAHVSLSLISLMGLGSYWIPPLGPKLRKRSNLVRGLHPDVVRGRDDANVGPPEVSYNAEQHRRGPRHGAGKGRVASHVVQLIANATPRKHCLEVEIREGQQKVDGHMCPQTKNSAHT